MSRRSELSNPKWQNAIDRGAAWCATGLMLAQLCGIARVPFSNDRFFAWAPHDQRVSFTVAATHRGQSVSRLQIAERYGLPAEDWHHWGNVLIAVREAETRRPAADQWHVTVRYKVNLGAERVWCVPLGCSTSE